MNLQKITKVVRANMDLENCYMKSRKKIDVFAYEAKKNININIFKENMYIDCKYSTIDIGESSIEIEEELRYDITQEGFFIRTILTGSGDLEFLGKHTTDRSSSVWEYVDQLPFEARLTGNLKLRKFKLTKIDYSLLKGELNFVTLPNVVI